jgi:hypothetical protein
MADRSLLIAVILVSPVAVLVGVFLGLPMLFADEGVHVDSGLIVNAFTAFATGVAAVGTVATLIWAVVNGLEPRRQAGRRPTPGRG